MRPAAVLTILPICLLSLPALGQEFDYLGNDDLNFEVTTLQVLTTGDLYADEWFAVRLRNDTDTDFFATEVHFIIAAAASTQDATAQFYCAFAGGTPRTRMPFNLRIWRDNVDGSSILLPPGEEVFAYDSEGFESEAGVDALTRVPLGGDLRVRPGEVFRVGINFPQGADICTGQLVQDQSARLGEVSNLIEATLVPLDCTGLDPVLCEELGGGCNDPNLLWRNFNVGCSADPPGPGGTGDLAIRLARPHLEAPPDTGPDAGPPDVGVDTGQADAGVVDAPDPLTISRVSPSMVPTNQDAELTIFGTGFAEGLSVRVGSQTIEGLDVLSGGEAAGTLLAGLPPGSYSVYAMLGAEQFEHAGGFVVTEAEVAPPPSIRSITPNSGREGERVEVTITGESFDADADVFFGGRSGTDLEVDGAGEVITVVAPTTLRPGLYDVDVENPDGQFDQLRSGWQVVGDTVPSREADSGCCAVAPRSAGPSQIALIAIGLVGLWLGRRTMPQS